MTEHGKHHHEPSERYMERFAGQWYECRAIEVVEQLAPCLAISLHHAAVEIGDEHRGVRRERGLDLERRDPDPVDLEHVVGAPAVGPRAVGAAGVAIAGPVHGPWNAARLRARSGPGDCFGYSVALSGDTLAAGAYLETSSAVGVNPANGQTDNGVSSAGAVYLFH